MRSAATFSASRTASASESFTPTPMSAHSPSWMAPVTRLSPVSMDGTLTLSSLTRWTTARKLFRRLPRIERLQFPQRLIHRSHIDLVAVVKLKDQLCWIGTAAFGAIPCHSVVR